ncbi:MAG TPA: hypothetical protein VMT18_15550 [Planctomycetota bacterium]|nr:hypothetical protein [Planctomycetota bacterium]
MKYPLRTIALQCELFHPPSEPSPVHVQRVHNELFQTPDPAYKSYSFSPGGAVLSNPVSRPGEISTAAFLADRFQFREELTSVTVDEFGARVRDISARVAELAGVQVFTAQQVTLRTLVNPRHFKDSREFMRDGLFGFSEQLESFGRRAELYGLRLVFPPTPEEPNAHALRVESFTSDSRSLFLENQASFAPVLAARGLEVLAENVASAYAFLVERSLSFVGRFDQSPA